MMVQIQRDAP